MKNKKVKVIVSVFLCLALLAGCSSGMSAAQSGEGNEKDTGLSQAGQEAPSEKGADEKTDMEEAAEEVSEEAAPEGPVDAVVFTVLSADDKASFAGKEMTADPEYLKTALSSEVYFCGQPLEKIEVHPILEWAQDYSSFTFSDEILGTAASLQAEEPFRIYDPYPEGIPVNCLVFYLEDGRCGTFALGYNGSGEEQSREYDIYNDYASMKAIAESEEENK